jgi:hypothetical protein
MNIPTVFNALPFEERAMIHRKHGKFLSYTDVDYYRVQFYEIDGYFVEVWYNPLKKVIEKIEMPEYKELDKHLDSIKLPL